MARKAEVVSIGARVRANKLSRTTLVRERSPEECEEHPGTSESEPECDPPTSPRPQNDHQAEQTRQLIHDDPFDKAVSDEQIEAIRKSFAARTSTPHTEMLLRLVGIEDLDEPDAKTFFERVIGHRREIVKALGRPVHLRVAALDLVTSRPLKRKGSDRCDSHPIIVTPSLLERAFDEVTADGITGLPQRAHFMKLLRHELMQRRRRSVCVAYIDLDGFKRVNDAYGHARGDEVLRSLAASARGSLREGDVLARIGGDEFAVLLVDATLAEAEAALRRLRARFEELTAPLGTSFSAGIAVAAPSETAEHVMMRADQAMYEQKRSRTAALSG
jgi:diguanylate cyclase (GGDEF)-like protein